MKRVIIDLHHTICVASDGGPQNVSRFWGYECRAGGGCDRQTPAPATA